MSELARIVAIVCDALIDHQAGVRSFAATGICFAVQVDVPERHVAPTCWRIHGPVHFGFGEIRDLNSHAAVRHGEPVTLDPSTNCLRIAFRNTVAVAVSRSYAPAAFVRCPHALTACAWASLTPDVVADPVLPIGLRIPIRAALPHRL